MLPAAHTTVATDGPDTASRLAQWILPLLAVLVYAGLAQAWASSPYVLHQWDTLFDADTNKYFGWFVEGRPDLHRVDALHPLLAQMVGWPIRLLTSPLGMVSPDSMLALRRELALAVSPCAAALSLWLQLRCLRLLGCPALRVWLIGLLSATSMAMLVFGSVPEQFALSGLTISAALYWTACELTQRPVSRWRIAATACISVGVVMSNIVVFGLLVLFMRLRRRLRLPVELRESLALSLAWSIGCALVIVLTTLTLAFVATWAEREFRGASEAPRLSAGLNSLFLLTKSPIEVAQQVLLMPVQALSPAVVEALTQADLPFADKRPPETLRNPAVLSGWAATASSLGQLLLFALVVASGAAAWWRRSPLALALLLMLWFVYWPVLAVYSGADMFLFSLHVLAPVLVLLGGTTKGARHDRLHDGALTGLLVLSVWSTSSGMALVLNHAAANIG